VRQLDQLEPANGGSGPVLLLLCGGDKLSQARDIERAKRMLAELDEG
jgi:putative component of toxin-antitoxin plasmid stabilization module